MSLVNTAEFRLPVTVEDHPVDVAATRVGFVAIGLGSIEVNKRGRTDRIVRIELLRYFIYVNQRCSILWRLLPADVRLHRCLG